MAATSHYQVGMHLWLALVVLSPLLVAYLVPGGELRTAVLWTWVALVAAVGLLWVIMIGLRRTF